MNVTTSTAATGEPSFAIAHPVLWSETWELYKRGLRKTLRRPIVIYFSVLQPLILLGLFGQMFSRMVTFPGVGAAFGTTSYTAFFTPGVIMMTLLFGAGQSGLGLIQDMDSGFLDKLLATPINRLAILLGKVLSDLTRMIGQAALILAIAVLFGVDIKTGLPGVLLILGISALFGLALAGINLSIALYTRNSEVSFLVTNFVNLPLLFASTALLPKSFLPDWLQAIAAVNPITYAIEGIRALIVSGYAWDKIGPAVALLSTIAVVSLALATRLFRAQHEQ